MANKVSGAINTIDQRLQSHLYNPTIFLNPHFHQHYFKATFKKIPSANVHTSSILHSTNPNHQTSQTHPPPCALSTTFSSSRSCSPPSQRPVRSPSPSAMLSQPALPFPRKALPAKCTCSPEPLPTPPTKTLLCSQSAISRAGGSKLSARVI